MDLAWEAIAPSEPCAAPGGHEQVVLRTGASRIPIEVICSHCPRAYTVVTYRLPPAGGNQRPG